MNSHTAVLFGFCLACLLVSCAEHIENNQPEKITVPGVVVNHIPKTEGIYIGSPALCVLPNGDYIATHDVFGPSVNTGKQGTVYVYTSNDKGKTWRNIAEIPGQYWSNTFYHNGALYIIGTNHGHGDIVIRRSFDGGKTWSMPNNSKTGLLFQGHYHTAPTPVAYCRGRIWRAFENADARDSKLPDRYGVLMISADEKSDLLDASNWTMTNCLAANSTWMDGKFRGWLEGNAVTTREGDIVDIARVHIHPGTAERAAIINVADDNKTLSFQQYSGFVDFPGGAKKFTIRYDSATDLYLALTNNIKDGLEKEYPANVRNCLSLLVSGDLKKWDMAVFGILDHPDVKYHGFHYVDWLIDGDDIIFLSRTGYDDENGGAASAHDANYLTFHRIENYKNLLK